MVIYNWLEAIHLPITNWHVNRKFTRNPHVILTHLSRNSLNYICIQFIIEFALHPHNQVLLIDFSSISTHLFASHCTFLFNTSLVQFTFLILLLLSISSPFPIFVISVLLCFNLFLSCLLPFHFILFLILLYSIIRIISFHYFILSDYSAYFFCGLSTSFVCFVYFPSANSAYVFCLLIPSWLISFISFDRFLSSFDWFLLFRLIDFFYCFIDLFHRLIHFFHFVWLFFIFSSLLPVHSALDV